MIYVRSQIPYRLLTLVLAAFFLTTVAAASPERASAGCKHSSKPIKNIAKPNARDAIGCLFNKNRWAENLKRNAQLERAAQSHSSRMASTGCFSHQCSGEPPLRERVARTGYLSGASGWELGEVLLYARDETTSRAIVNAWMNSSTHRSTIKKPSFDHVGVGIAFQRGLVYVTADFGHR